MAKLVMERKMGDNVYLHKDFHVSMDIALEYIDKKYGKNGVAEYLSNYVDSYHKDLIAEIEQKGFEPFRLYLQKVFTAEGCIDDLYIVEDKNSLHVMINKGFYVYKKSGYSRLVLEIVYGRIIQKSGCRFELVSFNDMTGAADFRVYRR